MLASLDPLRQITGVAFVDTGQRHQEVCECREKEKSSNQRANSEVHQGLWRRDKPVRRRIELQERCGDRQREVAAQGQHRHTYVVDSR